MRVSEFVMGMRGMEDALGDVPTNVDCGSIEEGRKREGGGRED